MNQAQDPTGADLWRAPYHVARLILSAALRVSSTLGTRANRTKPSPGLSPDSVLSLNHAPGVVTTAISASRSRVANSTLV